MTMYALKMYLSKKLNILNKSSSNETMNGMYFTYIDAHVLIVTENPSLHELSNYIQEKIAAIEAAREITSSETLSGMYFACYDILQAMRPLLEKIENDETGESQCKN